MDSVNAKTQIFNPEQQYAWKSDAIFPLSGAALQLFYNTLSENLNKPEAQEVLRNYQMFQVVQAILAEQVEAGVILPKEQLEEQLKNNE